MPPPVKAARVVVVGAGAFGGWTALELARRGAAVTLLEAWGPGHARSSSGGETRVIRAAYGSRAHYTRLAVRAQRLWLEREREWGIRLFERTGVLWMFGRDVPFARASAEALGTHRVPFEMLSPAEAASRYPQMAFQDVASVLLEPDGGYLLARRACGAVAAALERTGGICRLAAVAAPVAIEDHDLAQVALVDGAVIDADAWVFAGGAWLGRLFPDVVGARITATRQEVYYFGTPAGDARFTEAHLPAWIEIGDRQVYGVPGNAHRGFKIADDSPGPSMDPTRAERAATGARIGEARAFLASRFPALGDAPLVGTEVCQYEATPDAELIIDRHPRATNTWIVGGGSGHGFKLGPALGEAVAACVLGESEPDPRFSLARFGAPPPGGWQEKWR